MDVTAFLRSKKTDLRAVVDGARKAVGLGPRDVLLAVGSLVEGLGNSGSDLDLLLITPCMTEPAGEAALVVGNCLADIEIIEQSAVESLLTRLAEWASQPWDCSRAAPFRPEERRLLHRLRAFQVLFEGDGISGRFWLPKESEVCKLKLHVARHMSRTIQVDLAGLREAGDFTSIVFSAQELLGHAVDGLLAAHRFASPVAKWRTRMLEAVRTDWERLLHVRPTGLSAVENYWHLHRAPARPSRECVMPYALKIVTFSRAVFAWAERALLLDGDGCLLPHAWAPASEKAEEPSLPCLDLDVDFAVSPDGAFLARLNEFAEPIALSEQELRIALLFDGATTRRQAGAAVLGADGQQHRVDELAVRMQEAQLCVGALTG